MSRFFQDIVDHQLYTDWAQTLDWIVNDKKFDRNQGWTSGYIGALTKKIQKMPSFSKEKTYQYKPIKHLNFPKNRSKTIKVLFSNGASECKDLIRHIRNGIAHGNTVCFSNNNELYIEIKDFDSSGKNQTAYICFPMSYIIQIHKLYCDVKKSYERNRDTKGK